MALLLECVERSGDLARRQQFDGRFQSGVLLAHDLIESGGTHSGFLQLLEGAARFDALMLADIADQKHSILSADSFQELAHLIGARKARFIDKVKVLLLSEFGIRGADEEALQGSGFYACVIELARGAGGRRKAQIG